MPSRKRTRRGKRAGGQLSNRQMTPSPRWDLAMGTARRGPIVIVKYFSFIGTLTGATVATFATSNITSSPTWAAAIAAYQRFRILALRLKFLNTAGVVGQGYVAVCTQRLGNTSFTTLSQILEGERPVTMDPESTIIRLPSYEVRPVAGDSDCYWQNTSAAVANLFQATVYNGSSAIISIQSQYCVEFSTQG